MCLFMFQKFRVYESGEDGPVCFFIHGGGFSALSWAVLSVIHSSKSFLNILSFNGVTW